MDQWRVFVGMLDEHGEPEWTHVDERYDDWAAARDRLGGEVRRFIRDEEHAKPNCADCLAQAREVEAAINAAVPGEPVGRPGWQTIDGEDFVVLRVPA